MENTNYSVGRHGLEKLTALNEPRPSSFARMLGHVVSYVFHPLFIPSYIAFFLLFVHPLVFAGYSHDMKVFRLATVMLSTFFIPAFSVFLMWRLQLVISSMQLKTQRERIIPYAIAMIMYFWCWYVFYRVDSPQEIRIFMLGAFLSVCSAWLLNIPMRVSMHSTAMGTALAFFLILAFKDAAFNGVYLSIAIFVAGLVCTARFIVSHHTAGEIYLGLLAGIASQYVATWFI
jgi:hypothetical protein